MCERVRQLQEEPSISACQRQRVHKKTIYYIFTYVRPAGTVRESEEQKEEEKEEKGPPTHLASCVYRQHLSEIPLAANAVLINGPRRHCRRDAHNSREPVQLELPPSSTAMANNASSIGSTGNSLALLRHGVLGRAECSCRRCCRHSN